MDNDELSSRQHPVEENMRMQQRVWRFERLGWYALVVIVSLGLAGLFGNGPLSDGRSISADGRVQVDYQRISRSGTQDNLRINVRGTPGTPVTVELDGGFFRHVSIQTLQPEPQVSRSRGQALLFELGTSADGVATLYLTLHSKSVGRLKGVVRSGPASAADFSTFFFP